MSSAKRSLIILIVIFGTPLLGMSISYVGSVLHGGDDGSGIASAAGLGIGIIGAVAGLILGPIVSFVMRNSSRQLASLIGYFTPCGLALVYISFLSLFAPGGF